MLPKGAKMNKKLIFGVMFLLSASFLLSQDLVEASKKEQERRAKLKGKEVKVVTNADLTAKEKAPAVVVTRPESAQPQAQPGEGAAAEAEVQPETSQPQAQGQGQEPEFAARYASAFSPDYFMVENPNLALGPPDDQYAEISVAGAIDLEIEVNNGPGSDLAIYTRAPVKNFPKEEMEGQLETDQAAMWWGEFRYAVLGMDSRGEWQEVGVGSGQNPDEFDLGALKSASRIRVMFKTYSNPYNQGDKPQRLAGKELTFGLDAIGAIH